MQRAESASSASAQPAQGMQTAANDDASTTKVAAMAPAETNNYEECLSCQ